LINLNVKNEGFLHLEFSMISSLNDSYRTIFSVYGCDPTYKFLLIIIKVLFLYEIKIILFKKLLGENK
jgi:hypothetical protein